MFLIMLPSVGAALDAAVGDGLQRDDHAAALVRSGVNGEDGGMMMPTRAHPKLSHATATLQPAALDLESQGKPMDEIVKEGLKKRVEYINMIRDPKNPSRLQVRC